MRETGIARRSKSSLLSNGNRVQGKSYFPSSFDNRSDLIHLPSYLKMKLATLLIYHGTIWNYFQLVKRNTTCPRAEWNRDDLELF